MKASFTWTLFSVVPFNDKTANSERETSFSLNLTINSSINASLSREIVRANRNCSGKVVGCTGRFALHSKYL